MRSQGAQQQATGQRRQQQATRQRRQQQAAAAAAGHGLLWSRSALEQVALLGAAMRQALWLLLLGS
jgi:hypothetical protein